MSYCECNGYRLTTLIFNESQWQVHVRQRYIYLAGDYFNGEIRAPVCVNIYLTSFTIILLNLTGVCMLYRALLGFLVTSQHQSKVKLLISKSIDTSGILRRDFAQLLIKHDHDRSFVFACFYGLYNVFNDFFS